MDSPATLAGFVGNSRVVSILRRAVAHDRLPHALIFAGPSGVGKHTLARLLAQMLNCAAAPDQRPCGRCVSCRKIIQGVHPDVREIEPDGAVIKIGQVRELISELAYQPFESRYHVALLDPAEQMRPEGANSLLKTLEEPPSRAVLVLLTTNPYSLLGTILSRCRMLVFGPIPQEQLSEMLMRKTGRSPEEARTASLLSNGSLGAALRFDSESYPTAQELALRFVRLLLKGENFTAASGMAADLAKDKEGFALWLECLTLLLQEVYYAQNAPSRIGHVEAAEELKTLAGQVRYEKIKSAIEEVARLRASLLQNVNRQIAVEALFLSVSRP
jgi:DNA polymerase-3 subunit delta'